MKIIAMAAVFLLGISFGSFLNVLVYRVKPEQKRKKNLSWWQGRSVCDCCGRKLLWWENIPLVSFLFLKGRCRTCRSPIPFEYFLVELGTGLIYLLVFYRLSPVGFLIAAIYCLIATILVFIFLYDFHYQIIPDRAVLGLVLIVLAFYLESLLPGLVSGADQQACGLFKNLLAGLVSAGFFLFLHFITKGRGMGLGDVKFAFFMGLFLGPSKLILALYFAFLTGAIIGVILILLGRKKFGQHVPFGPFLVAGTFFSWFLGDPVISFWRARLFL